MTAVNPPRHCAARAPREPLARRITRWSYSPLLIWLCHPQLLMPFREWRWVRRLSWEMECRRDRRAALPAPAPAGIIRVDGVLTEDGAAQIRADWVVARFREGWERVRAEEGLPLPPLRRCCLATVDEPHTGDCGSAAPLIVPFGRHAASLPRLTPYPSAADPVVPVRTAGNPPWDVTTAQQPALDDAPAYGVDRCELDVAAATSPHAGYPCCVHCEGFVCDQPYHGTPCADGCNGTPIPYALALGPDGCEET